MRYAERLKLIVWTVRPQMIDLLKPHASLWSRFQSLLLKGRVPQSLLFVGPRHAGMLQFANRLMALLMCENENAPCKQCRACHLLLNRIHPDIKYICPEPPGSTIKIEQIRELQQTIYQAPQRGARRFIVIQPADKMNVASANALLKILEEPPSHTTFILIAEQISSIPATILSRCQKYVFPSQGDALTSDQSDYLQIGQSYPTESLRAELIKNVPTIIAALCEMIEGTSSPCTLAAQWSSYEFNDLLWLLYLVTAQSIQYQLMHTNNRLADSNTIKRLSDLLPVVNLFNRLDKIHVLMRKINHNMNQTLVLENLLLGYIEEI